MISEDPVTWGQALLSTLPLAGAAVVAGALVVVLARRGATGRLHRNQLAGIRTRATLASDQAWEAAHRVGAPATMAGGWMLAASGLVPLAVGAALAVTDRLRPEQFLALGVGGVIVGTSVGTVAIVLGAVRGHLAAAELATAAGS